MEEKGCAPNAVIYNTVMDFFLKNNDSSKVVELIHKMAEKNVLPNASTFSIVIELLSMNGKYHECLDLLPTLLPHKNL